MQHDRHTDPVDLELERQARADRLADHAPAIPRDDTGAIDVDRLEAERRAAGLRADVGPASLAGLERHIADGVPHLFTAPPPAPRLVVAGDVVAELERQHRRAYHRRQEEAARRRRRRAAVRYARDLLGLALLAGATAVTLFVILGELSR